jgi:hypothetical protein
MFEFTLNSLPQFGQGHRNAEKAMSKEKKKKSKKILRVAPVCVLTWIRKLLGRLKRLRQVGQICFLPALSPGWSSSLASSVELGFDDPDTGDLETGNDIIVGTAGSGSVRCGGRER